MYKDPSDLISGSLFSSICPYNQIDEVDMVSFMSLKRCVSASVVKCLYNKIDKVDVVSPMSLKICVSVSVVVYLYKQADDVDRVSPISL